MTEYIIGPNAHTVTAHALAAVRQCPDAGGTWSVTIKPHRKRRSSSQNATLHLWFSEIAEQTGASPDEVKQSLKADLLGMVEARHPITRASIMVPRPTASLNKVECMDFMERIQQMAAEWGFALTQPDRWREWEDDARADPRGEGALR